MHHNTLFVLILLIVLLAGCGGWFGYRRGGPSYGIGGFVLPLAVLLLIFYMLGAFR